MRKLNVKHQSNCFLLRLWRTYFFHKGKIPHNFAVNYRSLKWIYKVRHSQRYKNFTRSYFFPWYFLWHLQSVKKSRKLLTMSTKLIGSRIVWKVNIFNDSRVITCNLFHGISSYAAQSFVTSTHVRIIQPIKHGESEKKFHKSRRRKVYFFFFRYFPSTF